MSAPKRKRDVPVLFWVSSGEMEAIQQKMAQFGTKNLSAYLRKMALDGYVVKLDLPELKELVSLMRYSSNNLNQLARKVHETGRIYDLRRRPGGYIPAAGTDMGGAERDTDPASCIACPLLPYLHDNAGGDGCQGRRFIRRSLEPSKMLGGNP